MNKIVLDASALLALLNDEPGALMVQENLPDAVISAINLAEVVTRLNLIGMPEKEIHKALEILGLEVIPFDEDLAYIAGLLATAAKPFVLSLGDRACLALAEKYGSSAFTADKAWQELSLGIDIKIIR